MWGLGAALPGNDELQSVEPAADLVRGRKSGYKNWRSPAILLDRAILPTGPDPQIRCSPRPVSAIGEEQKSNFTAVTSHPLLFPAKCSRLKEPTRRVEATAGAGLVFRYRIPRCLPGIVTATR